jgi:hypothetical protein
VIAKSTKPERIAEKVAAFDFELSGEEAIDGPKPESSALNATANRRSEHIELTLGGHTIRLDPFVPQVMIKMMKIFLAGRCTTATHRALVLGKRI